MNHHHNARLTVRILPVMNLQVRLKQVCYRDKTMSANALKTIITAMILLLLTMQSVALKADLHQFHQTQTQINLLEHGFDEGHDHEHMQVAQTHDCQHCCHCHGGSHVYLASQMPGLAHFVTVEIQHDTARHVAKIPRLPAFRPPIA